MAILLLVALIIFTYGRAQREVEQRFNERLSSAADQLAHDSPAVRLTGVYALAGLADDWAEFAGEVLGELSGRTGGFYACRFRVQRVNFDDFSISAGSLVRCRLDLSWSGDRHRVITILNSVLDTSEDAGPQRLAVRNLELRGGTALPPQYRRSPVP